MLDINWCVFWLPMQYKQPIFENLMTFVAVVISNG